MQCGVCRSIPCAEGNRTLKPSLLITSVYERKEGRIYENIDGGL